MLLCSLTPLGMPCTWIYDHELLTSASAASSAQVVQQERSHQVHQQQSHQDAMPRAWNWQMASSPAIKSQALTDVGARDFKDILRTLAHSWKQNELPTRIAGDMCMPAFLKVPLCMQETQRHHEPRLPAILTTGWSGTCNTKSGNG